MTSENTLADQPDSKPIDKLAEPAKPELKDEIVETDHTVVVSGQIIEYRATTGRLVMKNEADKAKATVFFIAYTRKNVDDVGRRPLTISFNGGPGSSSVWLHLGLLGPRRVVSGDAGAIAPPPYRLTNNDYSLLDVTDLVFVDPVSTGYSRPAPGEEAKQFHGLEQDIESVGEFIRLYVTRYKRWSSPKFLIGESYGTTRAAGLAGYLQQRHGMFLNGLMLISAILNFQTATFTPGNDLAYITHLPTYAATAWYHGKLAPDLQANLEHTLQEVTTFAAGEYLQALFKGDTLGDAERADVAQKVARYTGLPVDYIQRADLRIEIFRFCKELLRDEQRTVGRLDSRFLGYDRDGVGENFSYDPSYSAIHGAYSGTFNGYVSEELQFTSDLPYEILAGLYETWDYSKHQNKFADVSETLRSAMTQNQALKVIIANGYYDFATPYFGTEYTVNHLSLAPFLRNHMRLTYYPAGHMMYVHAPSLQQLRDDLIAFLHDALQTG